MMKKFVFAILVVVLSSCWGDAPTTNSNNENFSNYNVSNGEMANEKHFCEFCGKEFHSVRDLVANSCKRHPEGVNEGSHKLYEGSIKKRYSCVYCGKEAKSIANLTVNKCKHSPIGGNHKPKL